MDRQGVLLIARTLETLVDRKEAWMWKRVNGVLCYFEMEFDEPRESVLYVREGHERRKIVETVAGTVNEFEGPQDKERLVKVTYADGDVYEYEGPKGEERMVKETYANGDVYEYEGLKGAPRLVKATFADGTVHEYSCTKDNV